MPKLYFIFAGSKRDQWAWELVNDDGQVVSRSKSAFHHYQQAVNDARRSGITLPSSFRSINDVLNNSKR